jgi:hypothetical protein
VRNGAGSSVGNKKDKKPKKEKKVVHQEDAYLSTAFDELLMSLKSNARKLLTSLENSNACLEAVMEAVRIPEFLTSNLSKSCAISIVNHLH